MTDLCWYSVHGDTGPSLKFINWRQVQYIVYAILTFARRATKVLNS